MANQSGLIIGSGGGHHSPGQQQPTIVQTSALLNQQLPLGATIIDAQTASLLLSGGATAATTNGAGQVQYFFAMPAASVPSNGASNGAAAVQLQNIQGLPIQGLPPGAQIILNTQNGQPTIFSMAPNRTDC